MLAVEFPVPFFAFFQYARRGLSLEAMSSQPGTTFTHSNAASKDMRAAGAASPGF